MLSDLSPFTFGQLVDIDIYAKVCFLTNTPFSKVVILTHCNVLQHQYTEYYEVTVKGDLSDAEIGRANVLLPTFDVCTLVFICSGIAIKSTTGPHNDVDINTILR